MVHGVCVCVCMIQNYLNSGSICYHKNIEDQGIELFLIRTENIFRHFFDMSRNRYGPYQFLS